MPTIRFHLPDGSRREIEGRPGSSLMQVALDNGVSGILAECGGSAACATCHVYVTEEDLHKLPPPEALEDEMLNFTVSERRPTSRLSCQIRLSDELDTLTVTVPDQQV
ncbi:2Fe-2S iron-sulfur cluster-binding protein [Bosea sp. (in: a-proteobacteria)]|uniref:2Fe-2S iron-sulfur cluster-binding protein n=1 Tax=Bosea sp. (in: a-proteobacteria) TaxID=1871050 RepID=UPI00263A2D28|nr:2Fe-2S iron-sulfur cluster-binding protein [Bosea sp. (in: a-proteobacteria)]MCO5089836.1 (2Fe-2S)-binding protein [Bosea sp. (in: a-proteobacteria)]